MSHAYFVSGGSEAMEAAMKMARQYFVEVGQPQRKHFIARKQSYHGNTLGALAVGGNQWRREPVCAFAHRKPRMCHPAIPTARSQQGETPSRPMASAWLKSWKTPFTPGPEYRHCLRGRNRGRRHGGCADAGAGVLRGCARSVIAMASC
jgi:hypothetical protein